MLTGNKGEWSEVYVLFKLLSEGKLFAADEELKPDKNLYLPILRVSRQEPEQKVIEFFLGPDNDEVRIEVNGEERASIPCAVFAQEAEYLKSFITSPHEGASFSIERSEFFLASFGSSRIKASSSDKTDISLDIYDPRTGYETLCGFSIKSEFGGPSTLLNASAATNFVFKVNGLSEEKIDEINAISGSRKIIERMGAIFSTARSVVYCGVDNETFSDNLRFIDSRMDEIIAEALIVHYRDNIKKVSNVVDVLEEDNPLGFPTEGLYRYKMKKFLCAVALGFQPATVWDGRDEANGGYIIVTEPGDVVAYHAYNRDLFEDYLLYSTSFERGSTTRHRHCSLYRADKSVFINLNLQIRF